MPSLGAVISDTGHYLELREFTEHLLRGIITMLSVGHIKGKNHPDNSVQGGFSGASDSQGKIKSISWQILQKGATDIPDP